MAVLPTLVSPDVALVRRANVEFLRPNVARPAIVNGAAGLVFAPKTDPIAVLGVTVVGERIAALDLVVDPSKLAHVRTGHQTIEQES